MNDARPVLAATSPTDADAGSLAHALLNATDDSIIAISRDLRFLSWNRGAEQIYGYTAEEVIGRPLSLIVPPSEREATQRNWERAIAGERVGSVEYPRQTKHGRNVIVSVTLSPMRDEAGVVTGVVSIARDSPSSHRPRPRSLRHTPGRSRPRG